MECYIKNVSDITYPSELIPSHYRILIIGDEGYYTPRVLK